MRIELYGVARRRVGVAALELDLPDTGHHLREVLRTAACRYPTFGKECMEEGQPGRLRPAYIANVDGERFVRDPETLVPADATLLILSADAGG